MIVCLDTNTVVQALAEGHPFHPIIDRYPPVPEILEKCDYAGLTRQPIAIPTIESNHLLGGRSSLIHDHPYAGYTINQTMQAKPMLNAVPFPEQPSLD